jgi:RHS repeat-associated protein
MDNPQGCPEGGEAVKYDPFGKLVVVTGDQEVEDDQGNVAAHIPSVDFAHCFSTKYLDTETGLYGYGFMYMDTRTGRWLSRDPVGERGGVNLYAFVGNNGIDRSDYLGLSKLRIWCEVPQKIQLGECGTFSWFIEWNVKPASGKDGGIVLQEYKAKGVVQPTRWCCLINTTGKLGG